MALKSMGIIGKATLLSLFVLGVSNAADMNGSYNAGIGAADQTKGVLTSGQRDKLYAPLTTDTQMTTLDGSKSGKVNLRCEGANPFTLDFYFIPVGGNNYRLVIKKDDGSVVLDTNNVTYNESLNVNSSGFLAGSSSTGIAISGVCENGLVYCQNGIWDENHCFYFKYVADSNGNLSLIQVALKKDSSNTLGQCSCTSESCGWSNIVPYTYVVGGVSRALMSANPKYQMSSGSWDSTQFKYTYYGMDTSNCTSASKNAVAPGDDNLSRFYSPNGRTDIDRGTVDSVISRQSQNNNSPYSIATKLQNVQYDKNGQTIKVSKPDLAYCFVNNNISIVSAHPPPNIGFRYIIVKCSDNTFRVGCDSSGTHCGEVCGTCDYDTADGDPGQDTLCVTASTNGSIVSLHYRGYDDVSPSSGPGNTSDYNASIDSFGGSVSIPSGFDSSVVSLTGVVGERAILITNDGCTPYENNSKCHILNKWICNRGETVPENCISLGTIDGGSGSVNAPNQLVRNGAKVSNGSSYPVQCYSYSTGVASYQICESPTSALVYSTTGGDFDAAAGSGSFPVLDGRFTVLYQYQCEDDSSADIERSKSTMASLNMNGNTAIFNDPAHPGTQTISSPKFSACLDTFCLVKTSCSTTEVNADSTNKAQTQGGTTVLYDKRKCERTSNLNYNSDATPSFTCPVNAGESILANCDCEENIDALTNTTISVLEAVDQMTKDWICSGN
ncbi:MAG: hypothetical protein JHC33_02285 [Ignisphaera sp.]|nr:hypothetical protein [Ignisphaera sp.]